MNKGYSLLELLVSLGISSVIGALTLSSVSNSLLNESLISATKNLTEVIEHQFLIARTTGKDQNLRFEKTKGSLSNIEENKILFDLPKGLEYKTVSFGNLAHSREVLTIRASNSVTPGKIIIKDNSRECQITISLRGALSKSC